MLADAAWRLGPRALGHYGLHRLALLSGGAAQRLRGAEMPEGPFLTAAPPPAAPDMPAAWQARLRGALEILPPARHHGPFDATTPALGMDLFGPGDIRPVWEAGRLACLPRLAQAACLWPEEGHLAALEARIAAWCAANPPFQGPHWACGQEVALRALHLGLTLALLGQDFAPAPAARALLALHARRIEATPHYARAQDNNHSISEPAGLYACGLLLGDAGLLRRGARELSAALARLVAPDGGFAQVSTGYHRLLLDVLAVVEWLRLRHGALPFPAPFAARAEAAAHWLARLVAPDGALPRLGHQDGSAFADLALAGPGDARGSAERALRLFAGASAGFAEEHGCLWLGLPTLPAAGIPARWRASGSMGWQAGGARALLRTGPLRFRPGQADLLHFELWDGATPVLTDAGTGAYNPAPGERWWLDYFPSAAAHNTITFDEREPMPRVGRFLHACWPRLAALPGGAVSWDAHGHRHGRQVSAEGRLWWVRDTVGGGFSGLALRWRLGPGDWRATSGGASGPAEIHVTADAPLALTIEEGWESPAYAAVRPCLVLVARARAPVRSVETRIRLP
ncbi:heparinase II/III family protein [Roseomonas marmotae]|uniref:heparinase II/III family protein n=1 Tax=Roseomonas marmotae TaxID=2768161 RepID=UPI001F3ACD2A|nr:heparinase II/III-family protein [Roseomonas marmotae]